MNKYCKNCYELAEKLKQKEQECEELNKLVEQAKDAPICFKCEQEPCIRQKKEKFEKALEEIEKYCIDQNLKYDYTACEILDIINKVKDGKECQN